MIELLATEKNLHLVTEVDPALPERVLGDPARLRQILINLAGNAVKFTEEGEVCIRFTPGTESHRWRIRVSDTGPGIPPDQHQRIFESFTQLDLASARKRTGTGLGLAICARLVDLMGGQLTLESEEGKGSTFEVDLPLATIARPVAATKGFDASA